MTEKTILLIEDNPTDERLTLRALRKNNIMNEVVVAGDGEQALDYLYATGPYAGRDRSETPPFIILDMSLPGVSGLEVLQRIRSEPETRLTPVVVLTSQEDPGNVSRAYELGANSYVRKPKDATEFADAILNLCMYWLLLNEPPLRQVLV